MYTSLDTLLFLFLCLFLNLEENGFPGIVYDVDVTTRIHLSFITLRHNVMLGIMDHMMEKSIKSVYIPWKINSL